MIKKCDLPEGWSIEAADFMNKILQRKPANRLGFRGPEAVKGHAWLVDVDWQAIISKTAPAPFIPDPRPPLKDVKIDKDLTSE